MLTKTEALEIVQKRLQEQNTAIQLVVVEKNTIEKPFGWIFFYDSKKYLETGQFRDRLAGNGPVIVNKSTGGIEFCPTNKSVDEIIADYEKRLNQRDI